MGRFVAKPVIPKRSWGLPGGTLREHPGWRSLPDITFSARWRGTPRLLNRLQPAGMESRWAKLAA
jgi:hypothetical protein